MKALQLAILALAVLALPLGHAFAQEADNYKRQIGNAISLYTDKKYDDAVAVLDGLTKAENTRSDGFLWLGKANYELGKWDPARKAFERYVELSTVPDEKVKGYVGIARAHHKEKNVGLAEQFYKKAHELTPSDAQLKKEWTDAISGKTSSEPKKDAKKDDKEAEIASGFWSIGFFGVCGGRTAWWTWVIGIIIYIPFKLLVACLAGGYCRR